MKIGGLQKLTLIDFPGRLAATVFLCGCNFYCPWCYNRELVLPEKIKNYPKISEKEFFNFLKERKNFLEGVCITGGEPTTNQDLPDFIGKIKKLGFLVKLDTNGSNPKMLRKLINDKLVDYVAMDVKLPREKYSEIFGKKIKIEDIEESIKVLKQGKIDCEFRTTVVPTILKKEDIIKIVRWISAVSLPPVAASQRQGNESQGKYYLQQFRSEKTVDPKFEKINPYPRKYLLEIQKAVAPFFEICQVRA